jgi:hypothetical protein
LLAVIIKLLQNILKRKGFFQSHYIRLELSWYLNKDTHTHTHTHTHTEEATDQYPW